MRRRHRVAHRERPLLFSDVENRGFARLALVQCLAAAGDTIITLSLAGSLFFSIDVRAASNKVALSLLLTMLPFSVVAPFLGPAMDRHPSGARLMLSGAAFGRLVTSLAMVSVVDRLFLFPVAFVSLVLSKAHGVAKNSLVPAVVPNASRLVEANSKLSMITGLSGLVAGIPGVIVYRLGGAEWSLRLAAIVFALAGFLTLHIRARDPEPEEIDEEADTPHSDAVMVAATAMAALRGIVGFLTFLIAFSLRRQGAKAWEFGVVLAVSVASSFAGAVIAPALRKRVKEERILTASLILVAAGGWSALQLSGLPAAAVIATMVGLGASAGRMGFDSMVQRDSRGTARGRAFAKFETTFQLVWVIGALIPVKFFVPSSDGYALIAAAGTLVGLLYIIENWFTIRLRLSVRRRK